MAKKGDIVTIYQDPLTKAKPEGKAKLIKKLAGKDAEEGTEYWIVQFLSDSFKTGRSIKF